MMSKMRNSFVSDQWTRVLATFFFVGFLPFAPGSLASLIGAFLAVRLSYDPFIYFFSFLTVALIGFMVSGRMERQLKVKDPSCVVIDEVAGAFIAFFMLPATPAVLVTAYFLFRAFDMFKIYPADCLERLGGSPGIMLDDLTAGIYTNAVMHIAVRITGMG